ncbi:hypothetical protein M406DRAFT_74120 [Cryphonectria parasitica EP155]|uniref:Uncharacterized protein n=1 Tax=Cryphonectria parasitica (strain ATCC 38755 / EP155) TaxID=660469 RepID=A0A9P4XZA3_CRYP1|nr:uncharacterized protein M406DRAFT_74120 [Cryphonectria parasitica EP155]KAF3763525.1 hypothetical protein M406DRAFT_74120 [Cryphonectria parasitica EP155]
MTLTKDQKLIAKRRAKDVIPEPTPLWTDIGDDTRKEMIQQLLANLRRSNNTEIAKTIEQNPNEGFSVLQGKIKSMRSAQLKKSRESQTQERTTPGSENTAAASANNASDSCGHP